MYHDFRIMNALIGDVYYVELSEVEKLFAAELRVAQRRVITKGNGPRVRAAGRSAHVPVVVRSIVPA